MKRLLTILMTCATGLVGCGGYDQDDNIETTDDEGELGTLQQALVIPGGGAYTFLKSNPHARCSTAGVCLAPRDKKVRWKLGATLNVPGFSSLFTGAFTAAVSDMCAVLNARGWDCASTTGSSNEGMNAITGSGPIGVFTAGNIEGTVRTISGDPRSWQRFNSCAMTINADAFLADPTYAGMSNAERSSALRRLIQHQFGHCAGLSQNSDGVMSVATLAQAQAALAVPNFSTQELSDLQNYQP